MAHAVPITLEQMDHFLAPRGFRTINVPGTKEVVFAKPYRRLLSIGAILPVSLRILTAIEEEQSRDVGTDAIRVQVWLNPPRPWMLAEAKRVHRVQHWRENLAQRLDTWEEMMEPFCPVCGAPTIVKKPRNGAHWQPFRGCVLYPQCKGSLVI